MRGYQRAISIIAVMVIATGCSGDGQIPQQPVDDLPIAPESERVDLEMPSFSRPTEVDNPLFPVSQQTSVLLLGMAGDLPFRAEVTLLPRTRIIEWEGQSVETLVSQYLAFNGGRIVEIAYDHYAQADDGSVWYFGEDVFNFTNGAISDTHGSWLAGTDGPACMIMPADPQVGDVYRPENIPGVVFEEVTVKEIDQTLEGPLGTVEGGIVVRELHLGGGTEDKTFAPDYGEFAASDASDTENLALAVPTDATDEPMPDQLTQLEAMAHEVAAMAEAGDWAAAAAAGEASHAAWTEYANGDVPILIRPVMDEALAALTAAVDSRESAAAIQAAIEVARLGLDLQLRYRPPSEVELLRLGLWSRQMMLDAGQQDLDAVSGDLFTMDYVHERDLGLSDEQNTQLGAFIQELETLVADEDIAGIEDTAAQVEDLVAEAAGS